MTTQSPAHSDANDRSGRSSPAEVAIETIAYLNTEYPSLSHTFIEREIRVLRARGLRIRTFSVRKPGAHGTLGEAHQQAAANTTFLLDKPGSLARAFLGSVVRSPVGVARAMAASQRLSPPGLAARIRHLVYAVEGLRLAAEMRRQGLKHVHVHMANNGAAVAMLACAFDQSLSYSLSIHGSAEFFHVDTWRLREKVDGAVFVRCISNFCRAQVMAWSDVKIWPRLHVVRCGIDLTHFAPTPRHARAGLRLLTVGRLHPIKAYSLLLEACAMLAVDQIDWSLTMIGDGPLREQLAKTAADLGIAARVRFAGAVSQDDLKPYLADADAMVVSSCMEGVPVVLMEAMASGLPVVSTNVGGIPELVSEASGVLTPPGSAAELARAIRILHERRESWPAMSAAARRQVECSYDIEQTGDGMLRLFEAYLRPAREASSEVSRRT